MYGDRFGNLFLKQTLVESDFHGRNRRLETLRINEMRHVRYILLTLEND